MKQFFLNQNDGYNYVFMGEIYFFSLILIVIICAIIIFYKNKIINISASKKKMVRIAFGIFLLIAWILRRGSFILYGVYNWRHHLDINFCSMTNIMMIIYCFTGNKKLYVLCYYFAFCGPFISIFFPSINSSLLNYSTINFFIIHHCIFLFTLISFFLEKPKYTRNDFVMAEMFIVLFVFLTYGFNFLFGTRYNTLESFLPNNIVSLPIVLSIVILFLVNICCVCFAKQIFNKLELRG